MTARADDTLGGVDQRLAEGDHGLCGRGPCTSSTTASCCSRTQRQPPPWATTTPRSCRAPRARHGPLRAPGRHPFRPRSAASILPATTGEPEHADEDWFIRRDGRCSPSRTPRICRSTCRTGTSVVVTFVDMTAQREAEQALRERDTMPARASRSRSGSWTTAATSYARPSRARRPGLRASVRARRSARARHGPLQAPRRHAVPGGGLSRRAGAHYARETLHERPGLARARGRIDGAEAIAYSTAPFVLPGGLGAVTTWTDVEDGLEADEAARERDVAAAPAAELSAARRRIIEAADAARAQVTRDLHDGAQQQFVSALLSNADGGGTRRLGPGRLRRVPRSRCRADPRGARRPARSRRRRSFPAS